MEILVHKLEFEEDYHMWYVMGSSAEFAATYYKYDNLESITIQSLSVNKFHQKKGIGSKVLKHFESFAKERDISVLSLYVDDKNGWVCKWYESKGYRLTGKDIDGAQFWMEKHI